MIYKPPRCFLQSFKSSDLLVREKKRKIDFQDSHHGSQLGFPFGTILAIFDLQVTPTLPTKYQDSANAAILDSSGTILAIFDLQVTPMLPTDFRVNWSFGSVEAAKNRCSIYLRFLIGMFLPISDLQVTRCFLQFRVNWPFGSEKKRKIDVQDDLGFLIGMILVISDLQDTLMLPATSFDLSVQE